MEVSDDMLMALAHGELNAPTAAALRAQLARDRDLQRRLAVFTDTAAVLRDMPGAGAVPQCLIDTIMAAPVGDKGADVVPLTRPLIGPRRGLAPWTRAIAAGVVGGVGFGGWRPGQQSDLNSNPAPWSH